jgi:hypothetical protein
MVSERRKETHICLSAVSKKVGKQLGFRWQWKINHMCNKDNPHYHFQLSKGDGYSRTRKVVSGPLYLKFRKIPTPLALPFGFFPNKKESTQGILSTWIWKW